ncbi:MAG: lysophospholipid acyltransferase family protein [Thermoanaerobaculia bacterium]
MNSLFRKIITGTGIAVCTVLGNLYLIVGGLFFATLCLVLSWAPRRHDVLFRVSQFWGRGLLWFSGVRVRASFEVDLKDEGPYVFMSNHQSLFDIPVLITSVPGQGRFLAKRSLFRIPVFGWAMQASGFIAIDRANRGSATDSFAGAVARLRSGASALVFPEGTRSLDGELLPLQRGGFLLALKSGLPIVPVGIYGSIRVKRKDSLRIRPGVIDITYGSPISGDAYGVGGKASLMAKVREEIARLSSGP